MSGGINLERKRQPQTEIVVPEKPKTLLGQILEHSQDQDDKFLAVHRESQAVLRQILAEVKELRKELREQGRGRLK